MSLAELTEEIQGLVGVEKDGVYGSDTARAILSKLKPNENVNRPSPSGDCITDRKRQTSLPPPVKGDFKASERTTKKLATLLPAVQEKALQLLEALADEGLHAEVIDGSRTFHEQDLLYAQGRTIEGKRVTNAKGGQSWHNYAVAFDIGIFQDGQYLDESPAYRRAGAIGTRLGLEWGGAWKSIVDEPHFQYNPRGLTLAQARALHESGEQIV